LHIKHDTLKFQRYSESECLVYSLIVVGRCTFARALFV
jgi:hypothetical protein